MARGDALAGLDHNLALNYEIEVEGFAAQALGDQFQFNTVLLGNVEGIDFKEVVQDLFVIVTQGTQQYGDRQLAAAVDAGEHAVLGIEFEIEPGTAVGNHSGRVQQFPGAVGLAAVMVEEHAWAAVQLRHDDAFGAVNDEGGIAGHQWQVAHEHFLFLDVLDGLVRGFAVVNDQADLDPQRCAVGLATRTAFTFVEHRLAEGIADIFEGGIAGEADDREYRFQRGMQAAIVMAVRFRRVLQEFTVGIHLDSQQIRHVEDRPVLAEIFADALFLSQGIRHGSYHLCQCQSDWRVYDGILC